MLNLVINAAEAMFGRPGAITVSVRDLGAHLAIEVRDRGAGIAPEDMARIFDPFFTTRRTGTGLGLAISRNIIEGLGGTITVASQPGQGTQVRIELPVAERDAALHAGTA
jgi:two-component system NtrC family sensor kinase